MIFLKRVRYVSPNTILHTTSLILKLSNINYLSTWVVVSHKTHEAIQWFTYAYISPLFCTMNTRYLNFVSCGMIRRIHISCLKKRDKNVDRKLLKDHCLKKKFRGSKNKLKYIYNDKNLFYSLLLKKYSLNTG